MQNYVLKSSKEFSYFDFYIAKRATAPTTVSCALVKTKNKRQEQISNANRNGYILPKLLKVQFWYSL